MGGIGSNTIVGLINNGCLSTGCCCCCCAESIILLLLLSNGIFGINSNSSVELTNCGGSFSSGTDSTF